MIGTKKEIQFLEAQNERNAGGRAMNELKPCPFCGGEAEIVGGPENWTPTFYDPDSGGDPIAVVCKTCACGLHFFDGYAEAAAAWNRRAQPESTPQTNADRIRGATDEKLANVISAALGKMSYDCYHCPAEDFCHSGECEQAWLDWLRQPVKEE
jgi:hypothetical protein